jgi:hypothetical protein
VRDVDVSVDMDVSVVVELFVDFGFVRRREGGIESWWWWWWWLQRVESWGNGVATWGEKEFVGEGSRRAMSLNLQRLSLHNVCNIYHLSHLLRY